LTGTNPVKSQQLLSTFVEPIEGLPSSSDGFPFFFSDPYHFPSFFPCLTILNGTLIVIFNKQ
jgi:hypothetical protein